MRRLKTVLLLTIALSATMGPALASASPKVPGTPAKKFMLCRPHGVITVTGQGRSYLVKNDNFAGRAECLSGSYTAPVFRVSLSHATATGPGSDASPIIYIGCSWGSCSPHSRLPARVSAIHDPLTTWSTTENANGAWSAAYDIWFNPRPIRDGQAATEMMIWLNAKGLYSPQGQGWPVVRLAGALWYVLSWETGNGAEYWRYIQFRKYTPRWSVTRLPLKPFIQYLEREGWVKPSWYLLNIEAGFEIWRGGTGLATTSFSAQA